MRLGNFCIVIRVVVATSLLGLLPNNARADSIDFSLTSPTQSVVVGSGPLAFSAALTNTGSSDVFLNADNFSADAGLTIDDSAFFSLPLFLSPAGQSGDTTGTVTLFSVTLDPNLLPGTYTGTFSILGGADDQTFDVLATQQFTIDAMAPAAVPEPPSLALMIVGATAALTIARGRKFNLV